MPRSGAIYAPSAHPDRERSRAFSYLKDGALSPHSSTQADLLSPVNPSEVLVEPILRKFSETFLRIHCASQLIVRCAHRTALKGRHRSAEGKALGTGVSGPRHPAGRTSTVALRTLMALKTSGLIAIIWSIKACEESRVVDGCANIVSDLRYSFPGD